MSRIITKDLKKKHRNNLKLVSAIFYQIFIFHQMIAFQKLKNVFLFHLKNPFCSRDIQIFIFPSFPLFLPVSHCFRVWSKINPKVYDIINCLNKNLMTHFVWYLGKEKRYDIETLSISIKKRIFFWRKSCKNCAAKDSPKSFFNFSK